jgi:3-deoxy-D-manno-octulosonic acid kinase
VTRDAQGLVKERSFCRITRHASRVTIFPAESGMLARMAIELITTSTGAILYDTERFGKPSAGKPTDELFSGEYWAARKKVVARAGGRGGVLFIRDDQYHWVLRHYRRGGLIGKLISDRYFWLGAERTRAFSEWRLLHTLRAKGFAVPTPVATRYVRQGFTYRADLITEALPAARTLAETVTGAQLVDEYWRKIGTAIAKLHVAGVHHADLNAHNILLGEGGKVFVLDFDRGRIRARGSWEAEVLARLKRSLLKIQRERQAVKFNERDWAALMEGYRNGVTA